MWVQAPANGDSTWGLSLVARLSWERAVEQGLPSVPGGSATREKRHTDHNTAWPRASSALRKVQRAPGFASRYKTSIVTNLL